MNKIIIDGTEFEVAFDELAEIVSCINDHEDNKIIFAKLCKHPSALVRERVALKSKIDEETARSLGKNEDLEVLRRLSITKHS